MRTTIGPPSENSVSEQPSSHGSSTAKSRLEQAVRALHEKDYAKAEKLLEILVEAFPHDARVRMWLGYALKSQQKLSEAIECFETASRLQPCNPTILNSLGAALHDQGRSAEAIKWYRTAIAAAPDFVEAYNNLGCALQDEGRSQEAIGCFERVIEISPQCLGAAHNLHIALFDDKNLEPSARVLEDALRIDPGWQSAHFFLGVVREIQGDKAAARSHFSLLKSGSNSENERLDALMQSWDYVRKARTPRTRIFGDGFAALAFAIDEAQIAGLTLEFGVGWGQNIRHIASLVDGNVHGFDSFEGLPESWENDDSARYSTGGTLPAVPNNVKLHVGWFCDTLPRFLARNDGPVSMVNVDCDVYSSTKTVLDHLGSRILPGTIIVFDEYLAYPGWKNHEFKAFREAVREHSWRYEYLAFGLATRQAVIRITS